MAVHSILSTVGTISCSITNSMCRTQRGSKCSDNFSEIALCVTLYAMMIMVLVPKCLFLAKCSRLFWRERQLTLLKNAALLDAVKKGDLVKTKRLLDIGANPCARDRRGRTSLTLASSRGYLEIGSVLQSSKKTIPQMIDEKFSLFDKYFDKKEYDELIALIQEEIDFNKKYLGQSPIVSFYFNVLGVCHVFKKDPNAALKPFIHALDVLKDHYSVCENHEDAAYTLLNIGHCYFILSKTDKAHETYTRALLTYFGRPFNSEVYAAIGNCFLVLNDFEKARGWYNMAYDFVCRKDHKLTRLYSDNLSSLLNILATNEQRKFEFSTQIFFHPYIGRFWNMNYSMMVEKK